MPVDSCFAYRCCLTCMPCEACDEYARNLDFIHFVACFIVLTQLRFIWMLVASRKHAALGQPRAPRGASFESCTAVDKLYLTELEIKSNSWINTIVEKSKLRAKSG